MAITFAAWLSDSRPPSPFVTESSTRQMAMAGAGRSSVCSGCCVKAATGSRVHINSKKMRAVEIILNKICSCIPTRTSRASYAVGSTQTSEVSYSRTLVNFGCFAYAFAWKISYMYCLNLSVVKLRNMLDEKRVQYLLFSLLRELTWKISIE